MRQAYKVWSGIAAVVFCIVAVTDLADMSATPTTSATPTQASGSAGSSPVPAPSLPTPPTPSADDQGSSPAAGVAQPVGELVTVTEVVDGDTVIVSGGRKIRMLGIDACEMSTAGGREAKDLLDSYIGGSEVRLIADGRRDKDDYGRLLRRIDRPSGYGPGEPYDDDIGVMMVFFSSVGVYEGKNDASPAYLAVLRERDPDEQRDCSGPPDLPASGSYSGDDDDHNMPDGALTGGFCRRKWWC